MNRQPESPRYVLILGGLFLIAFVAYQVGSAWMDALPPGVPAIALTQPYPEPESTIALAEPYPKPESTSISAEPYPGSESTGNLDEPYPGVDLTDESAQAYPDPEITNTPVNITPTPTKTEVVSTQPVISLTPTPEDRFTPTATNIPTETPTGDAYPGPDETLEFTPTGTVASDGTDDPYPGPGETSAPQPTVTPTRADDQPVPTPTLLPTPLSTNISSTQVVLPTLESTPVPVTTLPYTETLIIANGAVNQAIWLDDGSDLALATSNGIYLNQLSADEPQILDTGYAIISITHIPGDDWVAGGGGDSLIRIWDGSNGSFITYLSGHLLGVVRLSYAQVGGFLASASDDATVRIWEQDGRLRYTLRGPINRVVDMAVSSNGEMVAASSNQYVHIWNPQSGELSQTISQPEGWYTAVDFSPNSQILTTAYDGRRLEFWDTTTWERIDFIALNSEVQSIAYSTDGGKLAIGYAGGTIQIWDADNKYLLADLVGHPQITSIAFSPDDDQLVTSSADGSIRLWDLAPLLDP